MNNNNILGNKLDAHSDSLTYRDLRGLLPAVSELQLPGLKTVRSGRYDDNIFFSGAVVDGTMTIFRQGFYLYEEQAVATVCSVSAAGSVMNENCTSTTMDPALDMVKLMDLPWYWPLTIAGKVRLELNRDKHGDKAEKRYLEEQRNQRIYPVTPDFVLEGIAIAEEEERERDLHVRLNAALRNLTEKERQVLRMYICHDQERVHVARELRVHPTTVSHTKRRGVMKIRSSLMLRKTT